MLRFAQHFHAFPIKSNCYPDGLLPQLQSTLAALADVEFRYDALQEQLAASVGAAALRVELLRRLDEQRNDECEPLYRKLAELRERTLRAAPAYGIRQTG